MGISRISRQAMYWSPENWRRKGRAHQRRQSNVMADLREDGLTWENFGEVAVSGARWRRCVAQYAFSACKGPTSKVR